MEKTHFVDEVHCQHQLDCALLRQICSPIVVGDTIGLETSVSFLDMSFTLLKGICPLPLFGDITGFEMLLKMLKCSFLYNEFKSHAIHCITIFYLLKTC